MKKRLFALVLAALMAFSFCACSASSTSSSNVTITTSTTDENGNTTTKTSTAEAGVTVGTDGIHATTSTSTSTTDGRALPDLEEWAGQFESGYYGENEDGDGFWLALGGDPLSYGALLIVSDGGQSYYYREGEIQEVVEGEDIRYVLIDVAKDVEVPFAFYESEVADYQLYFLMDGDHADINRQENTDEFLEEFYGNVQTIWKFEEQNSASAKTGGAKASGAGKNSAGKSRTLDDIRTTWASVYQDGAEGMNEAGEIFLMAVDDITAIEKASFMMISADGKSLELYVVGTVEMGDNGPVLYDDYDDINLPFDIENTDEGFDMYFQDGDVAHMIVVSQDRILDDMLLVVAAGRE